MADLWDTFTGAAGLLSGHPSNSGNTWLTAQSATVSIDGSGHAYGNSATPSNGTMPISSWTPPGTDYAVSIVVGVQPASFGGYLGCIARASGSAGSLTYYLLVLIQAAPEIQAALYRVDSGNAGTQLGSNLNLNTNLGAGDEITLAVSGSGATVTLTAYQNGVQFGQETDTSGSRIVTAGAAGFYNAIYAPGDTDQIRTVWAGAIGGPAASVTPQYSTIPYSASETIAFVGALPGESFAITASSGSLSAATGTSTTYTAPGSGTSATVTWVSDNLPTHTATASVFLNTTRVARLMVNSGDQIDVVGSAALLNNCFAFALHFQVQIATGAATLAPNNFLTLASQMDPAGANQAVLFGYFAPVNGVGVTAFTNFLFLSLKGATGNYQRWYTTFDPFADLVDVGFFDIELEWNVASNGNLGVSKLSVNGVTFNTTQWHQDSSGGFIPTGLCSAASDLTIGGNVNGLPAPVGFAFSDIQFLASQALAADETFYTYPGSGTYNDIANFNGGYPAEVIVVPVYPTSGDVLQITGASPEPGYFGNLSGTVTGTQVVAGPDLGPTVAAAGVLSHSTYVSNDAHSPGTIELTLSWPSGSPTSAVTFTPVVLDQAWAFTPTTIVWDGSAWTNASATLTIPSSISPGGFEIDVTNDGGILPISLAFSIVNPAVQIAPADPLGGNAYGTMPTGNLVYLYFSDVMDAHNPLPVIYASLANCTIQLNDDEPIDLTGTTILYDGVGESGDNFCVFFVGTPQNVVIVDDRDEGCVLSGSGADWTQALASDSSQVAYQFYVQNASECIDNTSIAGNGYVHYSTASDATATYTLPCTPGLPLILSFNSPGFYFDNYTPPGGTPTTHAQYQVTDGTTTWTWAVDQTVATPFSRPYLQYRWTDICRASATATISGDAIASIAVANGGAHYASAPNVWINCGTGSGATATATISGGVITEITVTNGGSGYSDAANVAPPVVVIDPPLFVPADGVTSLTIVMTNQAGSGTLYADAVMATVVPPPFRGPDDVVTLVLADYSVVTPMGGIAPVTLTLGPQTDETWFPFNADTPRNMKLGFNIGGVLNDSVNHIYANRLKQCGGWGGGGGDLNVYSVDGNGQLTAIQTTTGSYAQVNPLNGQENFNNPCNNSIGNWNDFWGEITAPVGGAWTFFFTVPTTEGSGEGGGGNPNLYLDLAAEDANYTGGDNSGNPVVFTITPEYQNVPTYTQYLNLFNKTNGGAGDIVQNLSVFDSNTPNGLEDTTLWDKLTHPITYNRLAANFPGCWIRTLNASQVIGSNIVNSGDQHPTTAIGYFGRASSNAPTVVGILPVTTEGYSASLALATALWPGDGNGTSVIIVTTATPHGMSLCQNVTNWNNFPSDYFSSSNGGMINLTNNAFLCPCPENSTSVLARVTNSTSTAGADPLVTVASPSSYSGDESIEVDIGIGAAPVQDMVQFTVENGKNLWLNVPAIASDEFLLAAGQCFAANGFDGQQFMIELGDEAWDYRQPVATYEICTTNAAYQSYLWDTTGGDSGAPLASRVEWYVWRTDQGHDLITAGYTGVPAIRFTGGGGYGARAYATVSDEGVVTAITIATLITAEAPDGQLCGGTGYTSAPTVEIIGVGSEAAATAVLGSGDTAGQVVGFTDLVGGSGYMPTHLPASNIIRGFGVHSEDGSVATQVANAAVKFNVPMQVIYGDIYQANHPPVYNFNNSPSNLPIPIDALNQFYTDLSVDDLVDIYGVNAVRCGRAPILQDLVADVSGIIGYPVDFWGYETGLQYHASYGNDQNVYYSTSTFVARSPRFKALNLSWFQQLDVVGHVKVFCRFTSDGDRSPPTGWYVWENDDEGVGTGTFGENMTVDQRALVSQEAAAALVYASTSPTPTPTPTKLVVTTEPPSSTVSAVAFGLVVTAEDSLGDVGTGYTGSVTVAIGTNPGGGTLSGTLTQVAAAGVATFTGLSIDKAGMGYTLTASATGLTGATSNAFAITAATATKLVVTTEPPSSVTSLAGFGLAVSAEDPAGNVNGSFTANVTIAISTNPASGTLGGTLTVAAVAGVATFTGLTLDKVGAGYVLQATSSGLTSATTSNIAVTAAAATHLTVSTQPAASTVAGAAFGMVLAARDASGDVATGYTGNVTVAIGTNPGGGTLSGTLVQAAAAGVATFTGLSINKTGSGYTLTASATGLTGATSSGFAITPAAATQLVVATAPPASTAAGTSFGLVLDARDTYGNLATGFTGSVTVAIGTNPGGGTLSGTLVQAASAGVATFTGLSINMVGAGYTLTAAASGLTGTTTGGFAITAAAATQLVIYFQPLNVYRSRFFDVIIAAEDAMGNIDSGYTSDVTIALSTNPGSATLTGTLTVAAASGIAAFTGLTLNVVATGYVITASDGALSDAVTEPISVTTFTASALGPLGGTSNVLGAGGDT
jgi:hypothetical protein